jgi:hypothetical protein
MDFTRRGFLGLTAGAAVASLRQNAVAAQDDPLGVRKDFPALRDLTFLNTAYTGLIPQAVVDAAREWTATRASRTYTVGEMLAKADEARKLDAGMIAAGEDEIAFVSSTIEGENIHVFAEDDSVHDVPRGSGRALTDQSRARRSAGVLRVPCTLEVEPDTALDIRVHMIHDRSRRFAGDVDNCLTCHLSMPSAPAHGVLP